jgi:hypothetical protein
MKWEDYSDIKSGPASRGQCSCERSMAVIPGDYVFSDPAAFRHLAQEEGTEIVEENVVITGYQVYIVEQWACSRIHPVFVVTTFTGEESNKVCPFYSPNASSLSTCYES